ANSVLLDIMHTDIRNAQVNVKIGDLLDAIHDSNIGKSKELLANLEADLPTDNLELSKAKLLLRKKELRIAKDN
ncbi:ATP-binding protein, partial [Vibrio splendidus]